MPAPSGWLRRLRPGRAIGLAWLNGCTGVLGLGAAWLWGLVNFGGTEPHAPYLLFLILLPPTLVLCLTRPFAGQPPVRALVALPIGAFLLAQAAFLPSVEGAGYVHLALAWLTLLPALWLTSRGHRACLALSVVLVLVGAAEATYGLFQALGGHDYIGSYFRDAGRMATGTLINRSHFAGLVNMSIGLAIGLLYGQAQVDRERRRARTARRWLILSGASVMGLAVLLSQSRGGALSLLASLAFAWVLVRSSRHRESGMWKRGVALGLLVVAIAGLALTFGIEGLWLRLERIQEATRPALYRDTLDMIADHPIVGVGPGMYRWRFRPYQGADLDQVYEHAHNDYLQAAAEWGTPLALAFWGFILYRWSRCCAAFLHCDERRIRGIALGCATALFSIFMHSLVDFNLQIPSNAMLFMAIVAMGWSLDAFRRTSLPATPPPRLVRLGSVGLQVLVALLVVASGARASKQLAAHQAVRRSPGLAGLERATALDPTQPEFLAQAGVLYRDRVESLDLDRAESNIEEAIRLNPYDWSYRFEKGSLLEIRGEAQEAEEILLEALAYTPHGSEYRWRVANFFARRGNIPESLKHLEFALAGSRDLLDPGFELLRKLGVGSAEIAEVWPKDRASAKRLLYLLIGPPPQVVDPAMIRVVRDLWDRMLGDRKPPLPGDLARYLRFLISQGLLDAARAEWVRAAELRGWDVGDYVNGGNIIWNGSFELPISKGPFAWFVAPNDSVPAEARRVDGSLDGRQALTLDFARRGSNKFRNLTQTVVVPTGGTWEIEAALRWEGSLETTGYVIDILELPGGRGLFESPVLSPTTTWSVSAGTFELAASGQSRLLMVRLRPAKPVSDNIDSESQLSPEGQLLLDDFRLTLVEPLR